MSERVARKGLEQAVVAEGVVVVGKEADQKQYRATLPLSRVAEHLPPAMAAKAEVEVEVEVLCLGVALA